MAEQTVIVQGFGVVATVFLVLLMAIIALLGQILFTLRRK